MERDDHPLVLDTTTFVCGLIGLWFRMPDQTLHVTLTGDDAERLGRIMRSGGYASYEALVGDALASLEASSTPSIEGWLRDVVAQRFDAHKADPSRAVPFEEARRRVLGSR